MAQTRRRRLSPDARRAEILQAAKELFAEQGYEQTQLQQIAARIGASRSVFAPYFHGKEEIYDALFAQWEAGVSQPIHFPLIDRSAVKTLRHILRLVACSTDAEYETAAGRDPLLSAAIKSRTGQAEHITRVLGQYDLARFSIQPVMAYGQLTGEVREGDPLLLAQLFLYLVEGLSLNARIYHLEITDTMVDQTLALFCREGPADPAEPVAE